MEDQQQVVDDFLIDPNQDSLKNMPEPSLTRSSSDDEASLAKTETHHGRVIEAKLATSDNPPKGCYQTLMPMNEVGMPARWHQ